MNIKHIEFGIYYYPWYNKNRWGLHKIRRIPCIGTYDSGSSILIDYHISQMIELGIDYLVIEMLPLEDWAFKEVFCNIIKLINRIRDTHIKFTFLIDTAVGEGHVTSSYSFEKLFNLLNENNLMPNKYINGKPLILFFSTTGPEALFLTHNYCDIFSIYFPVFLDKWDSCDTVFNKLLIEKGYSVDLDSPRFFSLPKANYFQFWADTINLRNFNSFIPVIPKYNDLLLNRSPQLAPVVHSNYGNTFMKQINKALLSKASEILIYSWNEYFEDTAIEPTLQDGYIYFDILKMIINKVKNY